MKKGVVATGIIMILFSGYAPAEEQPKVYTEDDLKKYSTPNQQKTYSRSTATTAREEKAKRVDGIIDDCLKIASSDMPDHRKCYELKQCVNRFENLIDSSDTIERKTNFENLKISVKGFCREL